MEKKNAIVVWKIKIFLILFFSSFYAGLWYIFNKEL